MATVNTGAPIVRAEPDGERRWFYGGGVHTWKATSQETGGAFLLFEDRMDQGKMTPLHTHPDSDETMYVLQGEILMHMDGQEHRVAAGGLAVAPRGVPTPSWCCRRWRGCCACTPRAAARRSTGTPASRSPSMGRPPGRSTSPESRRRPSGTAGSRSWDRLHSLTTEPTRQLTEAAALPT